VGMGTSAFSFELDGRCPAPAVPFLPPNPPGVEIRREGPAQSPRGSVSLRVGQLSGPKQGSTHAPGSATTLFSAFQSLCPSLSSSAVRTWQACPSSWSALCQRERWLPSPGRRMAILFPPKSAMGSLETSPCCR